MRWRKSKPIEPPERLPEAVVEVPPEVVIGGRQMRIGKPNPDDIAQRRTEEDKQRAIDRKRMRESQPAPYGHMWMDVWQ